MGELQEVIDQAFITAACQEHLAGQDAKYEYLLAQGSEADLMNFISQVDKAAARCHHAQMAAAYQLECRVGQAAGQPVLADYDTAAVPAAPVRLTGKPVIGSAAKVSLARRNTHSGGVLYLECGRMLNEDMPCIDAAYAAGELTQVQVLALLKPFRSASIEQRQAFDEYFGRHPGMLTGQNATGCREAARRYLDKVLPEERAAEIKQQAERRYFRLTPGDGCVHVSGKLPLEEGTALDQLLESEVRKAKAAGDPRSSDQVRADAAVRNIAMEPATGLPLALKLQVIITDRALLAGDTEPATIPGYGVVPARRVRELMIAEREGMNRGELAVLAELQRLYTAPGNQQLVAMESRSRKFPKGLWAMLKLRDRRCSTPHCNNTVLEADHLYQFARGGKTSFDDGKMVCRHCNQAKESAGWREHLESILPRRVVIEPVSGVRFETPRTPMTGIAFENPPPALAEKKRKILALDQLTAIPEEEPAPAPADPWEETLRASLPGSPWKYELRYAMERVVFACR